MVTSFQLSFLSSRVSPLVKFCHLLSIAVFSDAYIVIHDLAIFFKIILSFIDLFCAKQISKMYFFPCYSELIIFYPLLSYHYLPAVDFNEPGFLPSRWQVRYPYSELWFHFLLFLSPFSPPPFVFFFW